MAPSVSIMLFIVFWTSSVSGTFSFFDDLDAGHLLDGGGALGVGLVVAVVVLGADVDEADGQFLGPALHAALVAALVPAAGETDQGQQGSAQQGREPG